MSALTFDKRELGNPGDSPSSARCSQTDHRRIHEYDDRLLRNTRRIPRSDGGPIDDGDRTYLLLSLLDETVIHTTSRSIWRCTALGVYEPRGQKYITDFQYTPTPRITYRMGASSSARRCWLDPPRTADDPLTPRRCPFETRLRLRPFLAFSDKHALTHANMQADGHSYPAVSGVKCRLYDSASRGSACRPASPKAEFVPAPDWYYDFEYQQDLARGYGGHEDLLTTGYFEMELKKGESVIFLGVARRDGLDEAIEEMFAASIARRYAQDRFLELHGAFGAAVYLIRRPGDRTEVVAGYPWHGVSGRQTFVALPGITLAQHHEEDCIVLDAQVRAYGMFTGSASAAVAADAPLWFFWTLRSRRELGGAEIWRRYGAAMKELLESYRRGVAGVSC